MNELKLSVAFGDYDRVRPLLTGKVRIEGVKPVFFTLPPEETFYRAFRNAEFDISELSFSSYLLKLARGQSDYVAVPVFLSRAFRHTAIYVRKDRIRKPEDLKGKRIGIPEYQLTALVWARALLEDSFGVRPEDVTWVLGGIDEPGRPEKIKVDLPDDIRIEHAPEGETISSLLDAGEIDGFIAPRPPGGKAAANPDIDWLFDDAASAARVYYKETGVFPIMHVVGIKKCLVQAHPWLPSSVYKAFRQSKDMAAGALIEPSAPKVTLPFLEEYARSVRELMGEDYWPYGVDKNEATLQTFLRHHHRQGLSSRQLGLEEIFHPSTYDSFKI